MKSLIKTMLFAAAVSISITGFAQEKKDTIKINPDPKIKKAAKDVGHKTAEMTLLLGSK